ncbi:NTP transferase domain-containing protein [Candidatus Sumerlaeota bacterium]|nr:NTP transferase domain-containing protein [Candidatus Sumerlaeota bacterium]
MKGVILAGGTGSRLHPLTKVTNKHLLPVGRKPMIYHPIEKMCAAGLKEILIVTGCEHIGDVMSLLGSGKDFGCSFTFRVQDEAGGIAQALALAEHFAAGDAVTVILGDNIFEGSIAPMIRAFEEAGGKGAVLGLKKVAQPQRFGVAEVRGGRIVAIEEKPANPKSDLAVIGIYIYDSSVYDIIRGLKPSARGEYEITDVNNTYIAQGALRYHDLEGWWTDAGTFESLAQANELVTRE